MFVLGHMGIGSRLVQPWAARLPRRWVLLGTLLPDLIDKPLYYSLSFATGRSQGELGLISCSRTLAHTSLFLVALAAVTLVRRAPALAAITLGVATHILLDNVSDRLMGAYGERSSAYMALVFPLLGARFAVLPFHTLGEHFNAMNNPVTLWSELIGGAILAWDEWKLRHKSEIVRRIRSIHRRFRRAED